VFGTKVAVKIKTHSISGFHRAFLQSIIFISPLNALDYTKRRS